MGTLIVEYNKYNKGQELTISKDFDSIEIVNDPSDIEYLNNDRLDYLSYKLTSSGKTETLHIKNEGIKVITITENK